MKQYANYHRHSHTSNIFVPDTHIKCEDYLKRIVELGYNHYWTTEHGTGGDIFEARDLCDKYNIKCHYGAEGYIVPDPLEKDNRNYHIIIIPRTNEARKKVNLITSRASEEGFYYKPRIFLQDLLALNKEDVYFTTACVMGLLHDEDSIEQIFKPLAEHFQENVFLEVQNHPEAFQKSINQKCLELSQQYNLRLIAANDSHYIYPQDAKDRLEFLKGKGINYGDEDSYILDYPDYDTMANRFERQGILTAAQIEEAIDNTRIFEDCEEILLDKEIKMPTVYPELTTDERIAELKQHIAKKFAVICKEENIEGDKLKEYTDGINYEMQIIEDTKEINTADYFLLNEKIVDLAVNKYGGVLTRTGRGSCGGFYLNRVLGMTQIDRFTSPIKLYPERFISAARLLENHSMPDIDYNVSTQEPFVQASKECLGEHSVYPMIAYGTLQEGEAFRNVCRSHEIPFEEFNEVGKNLEAYCNDPKWSPIINESNKYVDVIVSASVHPCAHAMQNTDLRSEYGVVKIGQALCVMITSTEADYWKILKDDFLIVSVWGIISDTFKLIGKPILTVNQLMNKLDDRIWKLYADGITCTLNQVDSDYATSLMKRYKAHSVSEMAQFTAAVRPSFDAWREDFLDRKGFTTGSVALDKVLEETEGRITFQETLMTYFQWLGVSPAESIGLIKKISKKKIKPEDFEALEQRLKTKWLENTGSMDGFDVTWKMVQGCMAYGFAAPHALATAIDSLYGAWLKVNYPLEYYTVVFGYYENDMIRTNKLTEELSYFGIKLNDIKFRYSKSAYTMDEPNKAIYKGMKSIKYMNEKTADELYALREQNFESFTDLLNAFHGNTRQREALIKLDFFSEFGKSAKLLKICEAYDKYHKKKILKKEGSPLRPDCLEMFAISKTDKTFKFDQESMLKMLRFLEKFHSNQDIPAMAKIKAQLNYLGHINLKIPEVKNIGIITELDIKHTPKATIYMLDTGESQSAKISKKLFDNSPFDVGNALLYSLEDRAPYTKDENGAWLEDYTKPMVKWFRSYSVLDEKELQQRIENIDYEKTVNKREC